MVPWIPSHRSLTSQVTEKVLVTSCDLALVLALFGRWIGEPVWALKRYLSSYLNAERCQSQFLARYCRYYLSAEFVGSWIWRYHLSPTSRIYRKTSRLFSAQIKPNTKQQIIHLSTGLTSTTAFHWRPRRIPCHQGPIEYPWVRGGDDSGRYYRRRPLTLHRWWWWFMSGRFSPNTAFVDELNGHLSQQAFVQRLYTY